MKRFAALVTGEEFLKEIEPWLSQGEIAGSIRRGKPEVNDVEVVIRPLTEDSQRAIHAKLLLLTQSGRITLDRTSSDGKRAPFGPRYYRLTYQKVPLDLFVVLPALCKKCGRWADGKSPKAQRDMFDYGLLVNKPLKVEQNPHECSFCDGTLEQGRDWGIVFTIRTGSAEYTHWLVTEALHRGMKVRDGQLFKQNPEERLFCPTEESFFQQLGIAMPKPEDREQWQTLEVKA